MTRLALVGALLVVAATAAIAIVVASAGGPGNAQDDRRLLGAVLFTTPAVIGLAGAWRREPTLLVAAGILCLLQSVVAFSGVTIVYLPAALAFLLASSYDEATPPEPVRWSPAGLVTAVVVGIVLAWLVIQLTGIFGVLAVVAVGGIARLLTAPRSRRLPLAAGSALLGVLVVGLVVGGWFAATASTREVCWVERNGQSGVIRETLPPGPDAPGLIDGDVVASGCDSGVPTPEGTLLAVGLAGLSVAAALALPVGRRGPRPAPT